MAVLASTGTVLCGVSLWYDGAVSLSSGGLEMHKRTTETTKTPTAEELCPEQ